MFRATALLLVVTFSYAATAGQERPLFSTGSDLVVLHVNVKDSKGAPVSGLTQDAFTVFEDGQRQNIQFFGQEDAPLTVGLLVDSSGSLSHMIRHPREIVVEEAPDGLASVASVDAEGARQVVRLREPLELPPPEGARATG